MDLEFKTTISKNAKIPTTTMLFWGARGLFLFPAYAKPSVTARGAGARARMCRFVCLRCLRKPLARCFATSNFVTLPSHLYFLPALCELSNCDMRHALWQLLLQNCNLPVQVWYSSSLRSLRGAYAEPARSLCGRRHSVLHHPSGFLANKQRCKYHSMYAVVWPAKMKVKTSTVLVGHLRKGKTHMYAKCLREPTPAP